MFSIDVDNCDYDGIQNYMEEYNLILNDNIIEPIHKDYYKEKEDYKTALEYISEAESLDNSNEYKFMYSELVKLNRKIKN